MEGDNKDVGIYTDMINFLADAIACERHAIESFGMNGDKKWLDRANLVRKMRSKYLYLITKGGEQSYCYGKHILGMMKRLEETGVRLIETGQTEQAKIVFEDSMTCLELFLEVNNIMKGGEIKNVSK